MNERLLRGGAAHREEGPGRDAVNEVIARSSATEDTEDTEKLFRKSLCVLCILCG